MTGRLQEILSLLEAELERPTARVAIVSNGGCYDESSVLGTRDGYLHLAKRLLELVDGADRQSLDREAEENAYGDSGIKQTVFEFPVDGTCFPLGAFLYDNHRDLLLGLRRFLNYSDPLWEKDPQFKEPPKQGE